MIVNHDLRLLWEILLNVILFIPVGVLARLLGVSLRPVFIFSLIFSLSIELTQYFTCLGLCEIWDDVMHNTVGGVIGWLACEYMVRRLKNIDI